MNEFVLEGFSFAEEMESEMIEMYARESALILGFDVVEPATEAVDVKAEAAKIAERLKTLKAELPGKMKAWVGKAVDAVARLIGKIGDAASGLVKSCYKAIAPKFAPLKGAAGQFKAGLKEGSIETLTKVKDLTADVQDAVNEAISAVSAKIAGQLKGRYDAHKINKESKEQGFEINKETAKSIVQAEIKSVEGIAKDFLFGVDFTLSLVARKGIAKDETSIARLALQILLNVYLTIGIIISAPAQIAIKVGGTISVAK